MLASSPAEQAGGGFDPRHLFLTFLTWGCLASCRGQPALGGSPPEPGDMVKVPAGEFHMGSDAGPPNSRPAHRVFLSEYRIGRTEVSAAEFARFLGWQEGTARPVRDPSFPAVGVTWDLAVAYCAWLGLRLPTEAEWEKAARGTDGRAFPWGDSFEAARANTAASRLGGPIAVESMPDGASPFGAVHMSGNAAEWVADTYDPDYYAVSPLANPIGPVHVMDHVLRGGSWDSTPEQATVYFRDSSHSILPNPRVGFRCAGDPE